MDWDTKIIFLLKISCLGDGEMIQSVKLLLCKPEDLCSDP